MRSQDGVRSFQQWRKNRYVSLKPVTPNLLSPTSPGPGENVPTDSDYLLRTQITFWKLEHLTNFKSSVCTTKLWTIPLPPHRRVSLGNIVVFLGPVFPVNLTVLIVIGSKRVPQIQNLRRLKSLTHQVDRGKVFYYESTKRDLKIRPTYECRCDKRLKTKKGLFLIDKARSTEKTYICVSV